MNGSVAKIIIILIIIYCFKIILGRNNHCIYEVLLDLDKNELEMLCIVFVATVNGKAEIIKI